MSLRFLWGATLCCVGCVISGEGPEPIARGDDHGTAVLFDTPAVLTAVRDGDTIEVEVDQVAFVIRLLGVDTPELSGANGPEPYAVAAHAFTLARCADMVGLEFDQPSCKPPLPASGCYDIYGRLLAYVRTRDGNDLGAELLLRGLAFVYNTSFARRPLYEELQALAQEEGVGMWSN